MRVALCAVVLVGCASGSAVNPASDGPPGPPGDDAPVTKDAPTPIDARPLDAFVPPDACVPTPHELLANPALDLTPQGTGWTGARDPQLAAFPMIGTDPSGFAAHSQPYKAFFGGAAGSDLGQTSVADSLYQDIAIPANATQVTITGQWAVGTNDDPSTAYDSFQLALVQTNGSPIETVLTLNNTSTPGGSWVAFSKTIAANVAGQTVRLRATSLNDAIYNTNFFLDTLSMQALYCP